MSNIPNFQKEKEYEMKKINLFLVLVFLIALLAKTSFANENDNDNKDIASEANIQNLTKGIKSENIGLKKHCIYFAGKYKIIQLSGELKKQYKKEKNNSVKRLILFSLYEIKNDNAMKDFYEIALNEKDKSLKNIASAAYLVLNLADSTKYYTKLSE